MSRYTALTLALALGTSAAPTPQWGGWSWGSWSPPAVSAPAPPSSDTTAAVPAIPEESAGSSVVVPSSNTAASTTAAIITPSGVSNGTVPSVTISSSSAASSVAAVTSAAVLPADVAASGGDLPASSGTSVLDAVQTIAAGESFDGGMVMFDRGVSCTGQDEGGDSDAVFEIEDGGSLSNVIIGPNQIEGVHCYGSCTLTNVWWSAVCEDAFTIKEQDASGTTTISGGGAYGAEDKVLQHNGGGTLSVSGFTVDDFGKLYRSCGNCDEMYERHIILDDITASSGSSLVGINDNYGDTATLTNIKVSDVDDICVTYTGNDTGDEPEKNGSGPGGACVYDDSDVTEF